MRDPTRPPAATRTRDTTAATAGTPKKISIEAATVDSGATAAMAVRSSRQLSAQLKHEELYSKHAVLKAVALALEKSAPLRLTSVKCTQPKRARLTPVLLKSPVPEPAQSKSTLQQLRALRAL
ncbi:hypothetical protein Gpo141_00009397 [Globisporangium polare]